MSYEITHILYHPNLSRTHSNFSSYIAECGRRKMYQFMFVSKDHAQGAEKNGWRVCKQCKVRVGLK